MEEVYLKSYTTYSNMKKKSYILILLLLCIIKGYSQGLLTPKQINEKINDHIMGVGPNKLNLRNLKDSVDLYAFAIELKVSRKNKKTIVESISVNDSIAYVLYKDFDFLKDINYYSVLNNKKKATVVIPVAILIAYVNHPVSSRPMLKAEELLPKVVKMFNFNYKELEKRSSDFIYLNPVMCLCGTKYYD